MEIVLRRSLCRQTGGSHGDELGHLGGDVVYEIGEDIREAS